MTTKHDIEIEGLPEGWRAVAYRPPAKGEFFFCHEHTYIQIASFDFSKFDLRLIVQKIKPCRLVLEETDQDNIRYRSGHYANQCIAPGIYVADQPKIWREVKEE